MVQSNHPFIVFAEFPNGHAMELSVFYGPDAAYKLADFHARTCGLPESAIAFRVHHRQSVVYVGTIEEKFKSSLI